MNRNERFHEESEEWDAVCRMLENIRAIRGLLHADELDKVLQRLEIIEKELDILSVIIRTN